jgi:hypothetical protein
MEVKIELGFNWEVGKLNLNEIVYRVDELADELLRQVVEQVAEAYQKGVVERLQPGHPSPERGGLGRHALKGDPGRLCRCRRVKLKGFRSAPRCINSKFGQLRIRLQVVECLGCGKRFSPLLDALGIEPYAGHEDVLENAVVDAVIDTNYRRLVEGHSLDVSLGSIHNFVAGSDIGDVLGDELELGRYEAIMADGTRFKKQGGKRGEMRVLVGITASGALEPIGSWVDTPWQEIERQAKARIKAEASEQLPLFVYDGEPGLDDFLAGSVEGHQRCTWHAPRGLYHAMWEDGKGKKQSRPHEDEIARIVAVEIPEGEYDQLDPAAIEAVREAYKTAKKDMAELIEVLHKEECPHAVEYLKNLVKGMFRQVEMWLATGIVAPKTTSRLERLFRELGRRLKRIAWGWSDKVATNLSKMIMIKQYRPETWKKYWLKKMGIEGHLSIWIQSVSVAPGLNI